MKLLSTKLKDKRKIVFFDLEGNQFNQEIIQIGAIKTNLNTKFNVQTFDKVGFMTYVKAWGKVGPIVTKITGITDKLLDEKGINYKLFIKQFKRYVGRKPEQYIYVAYGSFDKTLLVKTLKQNDDYGKEFIDVIINNYMDYSQFLSTLLKKGKNNTYSLTDAIEVMGGNPLPNSHDALVDTKNLILLYKLVNENKTNLKNIYKKSLAKASLPEPLSKIVSKLNKGEEITADYYNELIDKYFR